MATIISIQEALDIRGRSQLTPLTIGLAAAETAALTTATPDEGIYYVWSDVDCYFRVNSAAGGTACTVANGMVLLANNPVSVVLRVGDVINAITVTAASGTLRRFLISRNT